MQISRITAALLLCGASWLAAAQPAGTTLTLQQAVRIAQEAHAGVRSRQAQLAAADGERREAAALLFNNPQLSWEEARRRDGGGASVRERTIGLSQQFEVAGQQAHRRSASAGATQALRAEIEEARRQAAVEAAKRFYEVLAAQRRIELEQRSSDLFERTSQLVARRRAAGEDTRLDANVALLEAERARNALAKAREQLVDARAELAATLQMPLSTLPELSGDLAAPAPAARSAAVIEQFAATSAAMPRQQALQARVDAARARLALARAGRLPDVTVGVSSGREGPPDARERVTTLSVSVPLPLFRRNDAEIGRATAELTQAELERDQGARDAEAQVRRLAARLELQRARVERLQRSMLGASQDNQQLAARSRQAGQIGALEQLIVSRQALDAERELIDALADYQTTRIELESAAGAPQEGTRP